MYDAFCSAQRSALKLGLGSQISDLRSQISGPGLWRLVGRLRYYPCMGNANELSISSIMSAHLRGRPRNSVRWSILVFCTCSCTLFVQKSTEPPLGALPGGRPHSRHVLQRVVTASHGGTLELRLGNRVMNARCRRECASSRGRFASPVPPASATAYEQANSVARRSPKLSLCEKTWDATSLQVRSDLSRQRSSWSLIFRVCIEDHVRIFSSIGREPV